MKIIRPYTKPTYLLESLLILFVCPPQPRPHSFGFSKRGTADNVRLVVWRIKDHRDPSQQRRHSSVGIYPAFPNRPKILQYSVRRRLGRFESVRRLVVFTKIVLGPPSCMSVFFRCCSSRPLHYRLVRYKYLGSFRFSRFQIRLLLRSFRSKNRPRYFENSCSRATVHVAHSTIRLTLRGWI